MRCARWRCCTGREEDAMKAARNPVGLAAAGLLFVTGPAVAFNPQPEPPAFGMVGLARSQTAILNVVLAPVPEDGQPPCLVDLSFADASGRSFRDAAGHDVRKRVELRGNVAATLQLRWQDAIPGGQLRAPIRAVAIPVPDDGFDCTGLVATLEIVDLLGGTRVLYTPVPDDGSPVPEDGGPLAPPAFGMVGLAFTQTAILNVVLTPVPEDGQPPCVLDLSFLDASGQPFHDAAGNLVQKRVELRANVAGSLQLRAQDVIGSGLTKGLIRAFLTEEDADPTELECPGLVATLEIVDVLGATRVLYAPVPDDGIPTPDDGRTAPPAFGMVGLAVTQTATLHVVLQPTPDDGQLPCLVDLSFVDASGRSFRDAAGHDIGKRVELRGNVASALQLRWPDAIPGGQLRAPIRAVANPTPDDGSDCTGLVATLETVDLLGATRVLYEPTPDDGSPTPDDGRTGPPAFGMVGLALTQNAMLNVVLTPPPDDGRPPCVLDLSFVDASGRAFRDAAGNAVQKRVELHGNAAAALSLRWQDAIPSGQLRAPIRALAQPVPEDGAACTGLAATLEVVDLLGATRVLYSPIPDDGQPIPDDGLR